MDLINDSKHFDPPDVEEPEFDNDGNEIEKLTKEECAELLGEMRYECSKEK